MSRRVTWRFAWAWCIGVVLTVAATAQPPTDPGIIFDEFDPASTPLQATDRFLIAQGAQGSVPNPYLATFSEVITSAVQQLTCRELDGSPSISTCKTFTFDQTDGFIVSNPGAGEMRLDWTIPSLDFGPFTCLLGVCTLDEDYVLDSGDVMTGPLSMLSVGGNSPEIAFTPASGPTYNIFAQDSDNDLLLHVSSASNENISVINAGAGTLGVTVEGPVVANVWSSAGDPAGDQANWAGGALAVYESGTQVALFDSANLVLGSPAGENTFFGTALNLDDEQPLRFFEEDAGGFDFKGFKAPAAITTSTTCVLEDDASFIPDSCVGDGVDGGGGVTDKIEEGDSSVEVVDAGSGTVAVTIDGSLSATFSATALLVDRPLVLRNEQPLLLAEATANGSSSLNFQQPADLTTGSHTCFLEDDADFIPDSCVGDGVDGGGAEVPPEGFLERLVADQNLVVNSAWTLINFDNEDLDEGADFDLTTDLYTAPTTGWYVFSATLIGATETIQLGISINNNTPTTSGQSTPFATTVNHAAWSAKLTAGDTVALKALTTTQPSNITDAQFYGTLFPSGGIDQPVAGSAGDLVLDGDCDARTGDVAGAVCTEPNGLVFICQPTAGDCDTAAEWVLSGDGPGGYYGDTVWHQWDVSTYLTDDTFSVNGQDTVARAIWLSPDGLHLYMVGQTGDDVNEYSLATEWDLSSATFVRTCCAGMDATPVGIAFASSGLKMFMWGNTADTIREYTLSTAWNISTASFVQASTNVNTLSGSCTSGGGMYVNSDASLLYIHCGGSEGIQKYTMSTPGNVSTMSFAEGVLPGGVSAIGVDWKPDGSEFFTTTNGGSNTVYQFAAASNWSLNGATLVRAFSRSVQTCTSALDLRVRPDGTNMYSVCTGNNLKSATVGYVVSGNVGVGTQVPTRQLHVKDVILLEGRATAPGSPGLGDLYVDSTTSRFGFHDGTRWNYFGALTDESGQSVTCTNNAVGASAQALTLTPSLNYVQITNSDPDGCNVTLSETGAVNGRRVQIVVVSNAGGAVNFADTSGVTELAGAFAADVYDALLLRYISDRWVEASRSNN